MIPPKMVIDNANGFPGNVLGLAADLNLVDADVNIENSDDWRIDDSAAISRLGRLCKEYGSDKSTLHDYYIIYANIFQSIGRSRPLSLLEVGLGTNNPFLPSTMGAGGKPGASLRAFRDYLPNAAIYGADIDKEILFNEERIQTCWADQLNPDSLDNIPAALNRDKFDLIIDDGLHAQDANINTVRFALKHLHPGGFIVVEDINAAKLDSWRLIVSLLSKTKITPHLIKTKSSYMLVLH